MMGRMGWTLAALAWVGIGHSAPVLGQAGPGGDVDLTNVESTVEALYRSLSFDAGGEPDWSFVRGLFLDEAIVVFAEGAGGEMRALSADGFIEDFKSFYADRKLVERGFAETAEKVDITAFGSLAQAFVVFQPAVAGQPVGRRGLDCLQLTRVDGRWWIISVITDWEGPNQPIPERISGESAVGSPGEA